MTPKEFLAEQTLLYDEVNKEYLSSAVVLDEYIKNIMDLVREHDESNIDIMKDIGLDFWLHISLMRKTLANMEIIMEITLLKYKRMLHREWKDKRDAMDDAKYLTNTTFKDVALFKAEIDWVWRLFTTLQWEIKNLVWNKRSSEYLSI